MTLGFKVQGYPFTRIVVVLRGVHVPPWRLIHFQLHVTKSSDNDFHSVLVSAASVRCIFRTLQKFAICCRKMAVTRRRSKLWWRTAHQSKALDEIYCSTASKRDLKQSGTFLSKICMRPWIRSLWNILAERPLRDDFPSQNTILSPQKAPAGRLSG